MKNKLTVMIITFVILIGITPLIFGKLMNSRFNTMILKSQQQKGIVAKEVKNKSSYLTTDRTFEVTIPGSAINQKEIKYIKLITEATFKNLPVTNVFFHNTVKDVVLVKQGEIPFLKDNFVFDVVTSDFKHYKYKVIDKNIEIDGVEIGWSAFKGIYVHNKEFKNEDGNIKILIKKNNAIISFNHFISDYLKVGNKIEQNAGLKDIQIKSPRFNGEIKNINSQSETVLKKDTLDSVSNLLVEDVNINNLIKLKDLKINAKIYGLDKKAIQELQNGNDETSQESLKVLLNRGFNGNIKLSVKDLAFMQDLGFLNADINFSIEKGNNVEKINNNDLSFLNLNAKIVASPKLGAIIMMSEPKLGSFIKNENNKSIVIIKINKGKIYINGKEIKSN